MAIQLSYKRSCLSIQNLKSKIEPMTLAGVGKFVIGVSLAIALMLGGSIIVGLYFMSRVTSHPPKPVFPNEKVATKAKATPKATTTQLKSKPSEPKIAVSETAAQEPLEPGTYKARVNWSQGLSLRSEPSADAQRISGLDYNQQVIVLQESTDKNWQKVRLADGEQEGWIKAGNIEKQ